MVVKEMVGWGEGGVDVDGECCGVDGLIDG